MSDTGWHLDKRVPVSIMVLLLAQFASGIWMFASMDGNIQKNARDIDRLERSVEAMAAASHTQAVQLGRIEEQIGGLRGDIARLVAVLERSGQ